MTKLKWGLIGGGEDSQIGPAHRLGALADGLFEFSAAALDHRPDKGKNFAKTLREVAHCFLLLLPSLYVSNVSKKILSKLLFLDKL